MREWILLVVSDVVEEFAPWTVLHDQKQILRGFNDFVHLDQIWMPDELENMNLSADSFDVRNIHDFLLLQNLDGHFLLGLLMGCQLDFSKCPLP